MIDNNRYLRNIIVPQCGEKGQDLLKNAKVFVVGAGGLGSATLFYLVAAGVGNIFILDNDTIELSNLQRQILYREKDIDKSKAILTLKRLKELNSSINIKVKNTRANNESLKTLAKGYDIIVDCSDNFDTRFLINKFAFENNKTLVFAAVKNFIGQCATFKSFIATNPCYCCFNPLVKEENLPLPALEKGIIGAVAGNLGTMQAIAVIKEILMLNTSYNSILMVDFLKNSFRNVAVDKNNLCTVCSLI
jgi:molybdopterin/thiamine biosynthesis adenylyltransferase